MKKYIIIFFVTYNIIGDILREISVLELKKLSNANIIDIRSMEKYNDSHIPGSINIPKVLLIKSYSKYLTKDRFYYIYCQRGEQSVRLCRFLNSLGYHTINIKGGWESWILNN